jgi:hypothetical protein
LLFFNLPVSSGTLLETLQTPAQLYKELVAQHGPDFLSEVTFQMLLGGDLFKMRNIETAACCQCTENGHHAIRDFQTLIREAIELLHWTDGGELVDVVEFKKRTTGWLDEVYAHYFTMTKKCFTGKHSRQSSVPTHCAHYTLGIPGSKAWCEDCTHQKDTTTHGLPSCAFPAAPDMPLRVKNKCIHCDKNHNEGNRIYCVGGCGGFSKATCIRPKDPYDDICDQWICPSCDYISCHRTHQMSCADCNTSEWLCDDVIRFLRYIVKKGGNRSSTGNVDVCQKANFLITRVDRLRTQFRSLTGHKMEDNQCKHYHYSIFGEYSTMLSL